MRITSLLESPLDYFSFQTKEMAHLIPEVHIKPTGESLHQLRVAVRRSRAAVWCFKKSSAHINFRKLDQDLGRLEAALEDASHPRLKSFKLKKRRNGLRKVLKKLTDEGHAEELEQRLYSAQRIVGSLGPIFFEESFRRLKAKLDKKMESKHREVDGASHAVTEISTAADE